MVDLTVNLCLTPFGGGSQQVNGQKTNFIKTEAKSSDIGYRYRLLNILVSAKKIHIGRALIQVTVTFKMLNKNLS